MYFSPKTSADGLVFHYDTGNTVRSYLGEPTVNLISSTGIDMSVLSTYPELIRNQVVDSASPSGYACEMEVGNAGNINASSRIQFGTATNIPTSGNTFISVWVKFQGGTFANILPRVYTGVNWYDMSPLDGGNPYLTLEYRRFGAYVPMGTASGGPNPGFSMTRGSENVQTGQKTRWHSPQVEQKSHVTPFIAGTRSVTQGLKDLTAANTINLSNVSFDSNAQMTFDGTDDYVDVGDLGTIGSTYSIECVFKSTSVTSYKNVFDMNYATYSGVTGNTGPRLEQTSGQGINFIWSGVTNNNNLYNYTNTFAISANTYYHVAFIQNGTTGAMYVNGTLRDQANNAQGYLQTFGDFNIGRGFVLDPSRYFSGNVDMFKIFNRALTADEVARNFNAIKSRFNIG